MSIYELPKRLHPDFSSPSIKPVGLVEIDSSNRLNDQAVFLYDGYSDRDLTGLNTFVSDVSGTPTKTIDKWGKATTYSDDAKRFTSNGMDDVDSYSVTMAVRARSLSTWNFSGFFGKSSNFGTSTGWKMYRAGDGSGSGQWRVEQGSDDNTISSGGAFDAAIKDDELNLITLVWDGATAYLYLNGDLHGSVGVTSKPATTAGYFYIMGNTDFYQSEGDVYYTHVSRRAFSQAEVFSLHRSPYQILKPKTPVFYSVPSAAPGSVTGTINETLEDASSTASGVVTNNGSLSETLENATSTASGSVGTAPTGTINVTLENTVSAASGSVINKGSLSETLEGATSTASGLLTVTGSISESLADAISTASGAIKISGSISELLADVTSSASGVLTVSGSISETLENVAVSASGVIGDVVAGSINATLENVAVTAAGVVPYTGTINQTLENASMSASGSVTLNVTGTISETLAPATMAASGAITVNVTGSLAEVLEDVSISASGAVVIDYVTPKHNMSLTVENRIMTLTIEDREMTAQ